MTTLYELIGYIETKNCLIAMRFEPGMYQRISNVQNSHEHAVLRTIQKIHSVAWGTYCSEGTAHSIFASSFGTCQLMGFNLYGACGFNNSIDAFLSSPEYQHSAFEKFLNVNQLIDCTPESLAENKVSRLNFSKIYNGSIAYCNAIETALKHFGFQIVE